MLTIENMIHFFRRRPGVLVFIITFLVYSPLLLNYYAGDDIIIMERNTFYHSWTNIPRVLGKGSVFNFQDVRLNKESILDLGTGKDCYRPVSNLTYFLDFYVFGAKPFGSHLINILIHCVNAVLVYWIVNQIFSSSLLGVFAGLLFSLHPIQSEAVARMSIRADILSVMFVLWSFYFWIHFRQSGYVRKKYYYGSLAMYFLAIFSKESTFMLPLVILLFDQVLAVPLSGTRPRGIWYIGFVPIFIFFLFLYFVAFPTPMAAASTFHWLGGSLPDHCLIMGEIWCSYLLNIVMPWTVKVIPVHYCPPFPGIASLVTAEIGAALIVGTACFYKFWRHYKECVFFIWWYIIFYFPISNLIPIANPVTTHYMYLPSIGLMIVLAFSLHKAFKSHFFKKCSPHLPHLLFMFVILICVTKTLSLNNDWKSDCDIGYAWVRDYPTDYQGYAMVGELYFGAGDYKRAKPYLEKSVLLGDYMPSDVASLARCYSHSGQFSLAESLFKQINSRFPENPDPLYSLGEIYSDQKEFRHAQAVLEKALILDPRSTSGYMLLMKVYLNLHKMKEADNLLTRAGLYLNMQNVSELRHVLEKFKVDDLKK